ncbi:MAG: hypothetical protein KDB82_11330 [Planctomycetes bacterium]|nr:hypothetical protein [Planctomycetota bacterium]
MLEFAREQWLWLFALVGVFYVAWWFARRYRKQRVTYGQIWERVAKKVLPPGWKRIVRTALTLFISGVLLSSVVLYAAGLQRPKGEQPAPLVVFLLVDNGPGMRAVQDNKTLAALAQERAQQIVNKLDEHDRAALVWKQNGRAVVGAWLKHGDQLGDAPATDWAPGTAQANLAGIPLPPDIPANPPPQRLAIMLSERDFKPDVGVPVRTERFGPRAPNDGFWSARYLPPAEGDGTAGTVEFKTLRNGKVEARELTTGKALEVSDGRVVLPIQAEPLEVRLSLTNPDVLMQDNTLMLRLHPRRLATVTLCHPADEDPNPFLVRTLEMLLPGRTVETRAVAPGEPVKADLLVCDRVLPEVSDARFLLCFGVLPPAFGATGAPVDARPNLQLRVEPPKDLGFEVPELTLINGRDAIPLEPGHKLAPLAKLLSGETLVGVRRGQPELLYSGFLPHRSTLLQDSSGLLLLLRWLSAIQADERVLFPPFVDADAETEFQLDQQGELQIEVARGNHWLPSFGPKSYRLTTGADGRGRLGPFAIPGEHAVLRSGSEVARFTALRKLPGTIGIDNQSRVDLDELFSHQVEPDWRDYLPGALLWIALGTLLLEWLLWLLGITE